MASVILEEHLRIPLGLTSLDAFRDWSRSDDFPESGRIDYIGGNIEVDMSPEDLFTHGTLKTKLASALLERVEQLELGHLFIDCARFSNSDANLSVEPDILLIAHDAIEAGRVELVPKAGELPDRYVEIEGTPELVVEIVSDSSVRKDCQRLRASYFTAGVPEYWLIDARGETLSFEINIRAATEYAPVAADADGFQHSAVLACDYLLQRKRGRNGHWQYSVETKPE